MSKKRSSALILTVGTAIALTAGGAVAYWLLRQRGEGPSLATSTKLIPEQALVTFSISTNERQWKQLRSLGTPETQAKFNEQLAKWHDDLIDDSGLDYNKDVQPWIGDELTVALLPPPVDIALPESSDSDSSPTDEAPDDSSELEGFTDTEPSEAEANADADTEAEGEIPDPTIEPNSNANSDDSLALDPELIDPTQEQLPILVLPIADPLKARSKLKAALGDESTSIKRDYKGVEIQELPTQSEFKFAAVLDRQTLILTTDASALEHVIDTYTGEPSVTDTPGYRQALGKVASPQAFMEIYVNSAAAATLAAANTVQATPPQGLASLEDGQGVAATVTLSNDGFDLKGVSWLKANPENPFPRGKAIGSVLEKLPQDTLVMAAGSNFKQLWDTVDKRATEGIKGPLNTATIRSGFQSLTGLNIDSDLVGWMTGDFALALITSPETAEVPPTAGLILLAEAGDRATAEKTFAELDTVVKDRFQFTVTPNTLGGVEVTNWASPFAALSITRGWLEGNTSFLTIGNVAENLVPKPSTSLANNPLFKQVTESDMGTVNGYFFINIESLLGAKSALPIPPLPPQQAAVVASIQAVGLKTHVEDDKTVRFDLSVAMPTLEGPGSLPDLSAEPDGAGEEAPEGQ